MLFLRSIVFCLCITHSTTINEGLFWHVTDYHYDTSYFQGAYSCNKDVLLPEKGEFGSEWCDSPWSLINNSVYAMKNLHPNVDFIIWTGDSVFHTDNEEEHLSTEINLAILDNITELLSEVFPNSPTFPCFGNHDYYPDAQFPAHGNEIYQHMKSSWGKWMDRSDRNAFNKGGYYSIKLPSSNVRLVSLNTNLYYTNNKLVSDIDDPADQLKWLEVFLRSAQNQSVKVMIIGHVPPGIKTPEGFSWFYPNHNTRFVDILSQYSETIVALHFGHDHEDEFKLFYNENGEASFPMFIAPAVTPWRYVSGSTTSRARNPGIRLVKYDRDTGHHLDYIQYYLDLDRANREGRAIWQPLYQAKVAYSLNNVKASSLNSLRDNFIKNNSLVQEYFKRMIVYGDTETACDRKCRDNIYCGMRHFRMADYDKCVDEISFSQTSFFHPYLWCIPIFLPYFI